MCEGNRGIARGGKLGVLYLENQEKRLYQEWVFKKFANCWKAMIKIKSWKSLEALAKALYGGMVGHHSSVRGGWGIGKRVVGGGEHI